MGIGAPSFGSREYWDCRFSRDPTAFDWLVPATRLDRHIQAAVRAASADPFPRIHHIGCGTSALSFQLRRLVQRPSQVLNSDYSRAAVEIGRRREEELFGMGAGVVGEGEQDQVRHRGQGVGVSSPESESEAPSMPRESMRWRTLDLLSAPAMAEVAAAAGLGAQAVVLVVDKSTSDCIACVDDVSVTLPYLLQPSPSPSPSPPTPDAEPPPPTPPTSAKIHPLHVLAVNLAATTAPGGRWLCVSYSGARFPFLDPQPTRADEGALRGDVLAAGFVHPGRLWRLEACERIEVEAEEDGDGDEDDKGRGRGGAGVAVVHRPRIAHHLYVLVRTELRLHVVAGDGTLGSGGT